MVKRTNGRWEGEYGTRSTFGPDACGFIPREEYEAKFGRKMSTEPTSGYIGEALKRYLKAYDMTISDLAEETGISYHTLEKYSRNYRKASSERISTLAYYFGVTPSDLMSGSMVDEPQEARLNVSPIISFLEKSKSDHQERVESGLAEVKSALDKLLELQRRFLAEVSAHNSLVAEKLARIVSLLEELVERKGSSPGGMEGRQQNNGSVEVENHTGSGILRRMNPFS